MTRQPPHLSSHLSQPIQSGPLPSLKHACPLPGSQQLLKGAGVHRRLSCQVLHTLLQSPLLHHQLRNSALTRSQRGCHVTALFGQRFDLVVESGVGVLQLTGMDQGSAQRSLCVHGLLQVLSTGALGSSHTCSQACAGLHLHCNALLQTRLLLPSILQFGAQRRDQCACSSGRGLGLLALLLQGRQGSQCRRVLPSKRIQSGHASVHCLCLGSAGTLQLSDGGTRGHHVCLQALCFALQRSHVVLQGAGRSLGGCQRCRLYHMLSLKHLQCAHCCSVSSGQVVNAGLGRSPASNGVLRLALQQCRPRLLLGHTLGQLHGRGFCTPQRRASRAVIILRTHQRGLDVQQQGVHCSALLLCSLHRCCQPCVLLQVLARRGLCCPQSRCNTADLCKKLGIGERQ